jgi:serine/threonine-protein kinase
LSAYRIDTELGRGGWAIVYAGHQEELDRPVALKLLAEHLAGDNEFRARFLREARIAARLHHPNLVRTFDITELDGLPCIVMELLPGGTLAGGRLTHDEASAVASGLAYAHAQGVVHRDLKPANLLRGAHGEVKVADFGIARAVEETNLTLAGTVLGTLRYLAPEQAEGRLVGPEADVYSLGVVLEELLDPPAPDLVRRCCATDPADRPTAADVAAELGATTVLARRRRPGARSAILAGVALLAVVAAIVAAATHGGGSSSGSAQVRPVAHSAHATQEARNLEAWLKTYSR